MNDVIYVGKKMAQFVLAIFLLSFIVFYMARLSPGDPLLSYYGDGVERMSAAQKQVAMEKLGLNQPIYQQYIKWTADAAHGNYGISYKYKQNVTTVIEDVYINTVILGGLSYILTFLLALLLGIFCTLHEDKPVDRIICKVGVVTTCIPSFWVSLLLILIFSINLEILPSSGAYAIGQSKDILSRVEHLILPLIVIGLTP